MAGQFSEGYDLSTSPSAYRADYYLGADGKPQKTFDLNDLTLSRAQAMAESMGVPAGGRILDYGCGLGALTAAFVKLGTGIDASPHAIEHALPQAKKFVRHVGQQALFNFDPGTFD